MDVNTAWKQDMDRLERQLARKLKANTPSDAVLADIAANRRDRTILATIAARLGTAWHAATARLHQPDPTPAPHR
jgi:hypothetical protein